jgi:hypothetical protein
MWHVCGKKKNGFRILVGKYEAKNLWRHRWMVGKYNYLKGTGWDGVDCIKLAQDPYSWRALVNTVTNIQVMQNGRNVVSSWESITSKRTLLYVVGWVVSHSVSQSASQASGWQWCQLPPSEYEYLPIYNNSVCQNIVSFLSLLLFAAAAK